MLYNCSRDYYDVLHVHQSADEATIKRAYRKLALKMHPDKVQGNEEDKKVAAEKFAEVSHGKKWMFDQIQRHVHIIALA